MKRSSLEKQEDFKKACNDLIFALKETVFFKVCDGFCKLLQSVIDKFK